MLGVNSVLGLFVVEGFPEADEVDPHSRGMRGTIGKHEACPLRPQSIP